MKIIIIGAGFSGLATANLLAARGIPRDDIIILEKNSKIGGLIQTHHHDGYVLESGPQAFRGTARNMHEFLKITGLLEKVVPSRSTVNIRYILHQGKLKKLPTGPLSALTTSVISFKSKLRILKEPFVKRWEDGEESVADFVRRRFGSGLDHLVDAFVTGVYGGNHEKLSLDHAFPQLRQLERMKGSVIRGGLHVARQAKKQRKRQDDDQKKTTKKKRKKQPFLYTFQKGLKQGIELLARNLDIQLNVTVTGIEFNEKNKMYKVTTNMGDHDVDNVVIAANPNSLGEIQLFDLNFDQKVPEARIASVYLGYNADAFPSPPKGYGFLIPSTENRFILGIQFISDIFPHLAPPRKVLLRCFIGGVRQPDRASLPNDELVNNSIDEVASLLSAKKDPEFTQVVRPIGGIPQIELGHGSVIKYKEILEQEYGIHVTGIGWTGISTDHLAGEAFKIVESIIQSHQASS